MSFDIASCSLAGGFLLILRRKDERRSRVVEIASRSENFLARVVEWSARGDAGSCDAKPNGTKNFNF